jgi:hypothetical protein
MSTNLFQCLFIDHICQKGFNDERMPNNQQGHGTALAVRSGGGGGVFITRVDFSNKNVLVKCQDIFSLPLHKKKKE